MPPAPIAFAVQATYNGKSDSVSHLENDVGRVVTYASTDSTAVSSEAQDAVQFNVANGLIVGSQGALRPTATITRAER